MSAQPKIELSILWSIGVLALTAAACTSTIAVPERSPTRPTIWAIATTRDARIDSILRANGAQLDGVVSNECQLDSLTGQPVQLHSTSTELPTGVRQIANVTTRIDGRYHPGVIRTLAGNSSAINLAASRLAALTSRAQQQTVILDFEEQSRNDLPALLEVLRTMRDTLRAHGATVGVQIPGADTAAYPTAALLGVADFLVVTLDNEHSAMSGAGVVASPAWVRRTLAKRVADVGPNKLVALLPTFSYLWRNNQVGEQISFRTARRLASEASVDIVRDPTSQSLHAVQPGNWELWLTDASLLFALEAEVRSLGVERIALRQVGLEDPEIWNQQTQTISKSR
jgi:spore germination protein YaaH